MSGLRRRVKLLLKRSPVPALALIRWQRWTRRGQRRVLFFPDLMMTGDSGDLRAVALCRELSALGWQAITVPHWLTLEDRRRVLRSVRPHVLVFQQVRHPLNRPELYPEYPVVFDADDADYVEHRELVAGCAKHCALATVGNHHLAEVFRSFGVPATEVIWTGTYVHQVSGSVRNEQRAPRITWAHSRPHDYPHEASFVQELMLRLAQERSFVFRIYGNAHRWLEEWASPLREAGVTVEIHPLRPLRPFVASLADCAVGLQPVPAEHAFAAGKSFGKILAYLAADVAVVASNSVDHPYFFRTGETGILADSLEEWLTGCRTLLDDVALRGSMVRAARVDFERRLTTKAAAERMDQALRPLLPQELR